MLKRSLVKGIYSFMFSIGIYVLIQFCIMAFAGGNVTFLPVLPEFAAHFTNLYTAVYAQSVLIGVISAAFGAGSVIMELEKMNLLLQSFLYFAVTTAVWLPVGCFVWGLHKYPVTMLVLSISYAISYVISWSVQYWLCKKNVDQINQKLLEWGDDDESGN